MLYNIYIKNYAIIDELKISFDEHLNVITGETGAGKSIILGALSLILGDRVDTSVLINRSEKCIIEATFKTKDNAKLNSLLQEEDLDIDDFTLIRREISTSGKSRAFINDTPVNLSILNKITANLVDLHRQFDNYVLKDQQFMYEVVDAISDNAIYLKQYVSAFKNFKNLQKKLQDAISQQTEWQKESDYKQFLFDELEEAKFQKNEIEDAENNLKKLSHSEQIKLTLSEIYFALEESEIPINQELKRASQKLYGITEVFPESVEIAKRLESVSIEIDDLAHELDKMKESVSLDPQELEQLQERLDLAYHLLKKHQVQTTEELLSIQKSLENELAHFEHADEDIKNLETQLQKEEEHIKKLALQIRENRLKYAPAFSEEVNRLLHLIGMPNASLKIQILPAEQFNEYGKDHIDFLWDANKSGQFQAIQKSASGGELSRIMLCIKSLTAKAMALPTLIFDEVDTGISGEAARQVGFLLRNIGEQHQVLCITHQPQVAAKGSTHYFVYKIEENQKVNTKIKSLSQNDRALHLAQMIGGENPSEAALKNALELLEE